jgi:hypothetical protein
MPADQLLTRTDSDLTSHILPPCTTGFFEVPMSLLLLSLVACVPVEGVDTTGTDTPGITTPETEGPAPAYRERFSPDDMVGELAVAKGCDGQRVECPPLADLELCGALAEYMPTVIHATWSGTPGVIRYDDGATVRIAQGQETETGYETWLVGPSAYSEVTYWFESQDGADTSETQVLQVGDLLVPPFEGTIETSGNEALVDGLVFASWFGGPATQHNQRSGAALIDRDGTPVWAISALEGYRIAAAEWTPSGVWTLQEIEVGSVGENQIVFMGIDGSVDSILSAPDAHHDLVVFEDGTIGWLETDIREVDDLGPIGGEPINVVGDRIVRALEDGTREVLFETWAEFEVDPDSRTWNTEFYENAKDWTHANGLSLNTDRNSLLLSMLGLTTILEIDVVAGEVLWSLESENLEEEETRFSGMHSPIWSATDKIKIFVNASINGPENSYAAEFDLSLDPPREVWNSGRDESTLFTHALGRVEQLELEHTLVNYGTAAVLEEINLDGESLWRWTLDEIWVFGESSVLTLYEE